MNSKVIKKKTLAFLSVAALLSCGFIPSARGSTITISATEEAMVQSGQPNLVWDPKGAIEFSGNGLNTSSSGNIEYGLMEFNSSSIASSLNSTYGIGGWAITGVNVSLAGNFATAGVYPNNSVFNEIEPGNFTLSWLSNDGWVSAQSGGVTWNNLPNYVPGASNSNLQEAEGTFSWAADGVHGTDSSPISYALTPTSDLLNDIKGGGFVSIIGTPADNEVGYLSNTPLQGNPALLVVTAVAVPEPRSAVLIPDRSPESRRHGQEVARTQAGVCTCSLCHDTNHRNTAETDFPRWTTSRSSSPSHNDCQNDIRRCSFGVRLYNEGVRAECYAGSEQLEYPDPGR